MRDIESSIDTVSAGGAQDLPIEKRLALLTEWRDALIGIVTADPNAIETRRRIDSINDEIAALRCACVLPDLD
jgi:hypothetical protein